MVLVFTARKACAFQTLFVSSYEKEISMTTDSFGALTKLQVPGQTSVNYFSLPKLGSDIGIDLNTLPYSIRILLEACLRHEDGFVTTRDHVMAVARWSPGELEDSEIPFKPGRVVLQDFTGVPAVVDLAALRSAMQRMGGDPKKINPLVPCDLVVDHSVQVDEFASRLALHRNVEIEFERNMERYQFLRWGQMAFENFRVVPPATGIVHQVNLEYLASCVMVNQDGVAYPDSLVGTDSHTTMINSLGVVGWGVGGIEAEAVMLGQPVYMLLPKVIGFELTGKLPEGSTATDLVLRVVEMLRAHGCVGQFVEFYGDGVRQLSLADRATLANMAPEYGATMGFFPVDAETLNYLRRTGRSEEQVVLVEHYMKAQGLFVDENSTTPNFSSRLHLDMSSVLPSLAGPKRPQDRILLSDMKSGWQTSLTSTFGKEEPTKPVVVTFDGSDSTEHTITDGAVVIAAITSCTNTSNPSVMIAAGLLAQNAVSKGLTRKPWVKTSLAPGSRVVTDYLQKAGLDQYLDALGFHTVGYGCTTCIGNSGPLPDPVARAVNEGNLVAAAVLSGNRNFEGRVNPLVKANYLASPPFVVAYALTGTVNFDFETTPLGQDQDGNDVFLRDIWPTQKEIAEAISSSISPKQFISQYSGDGPEQWQAIKTPDGDLFDWDQSSTYVQEPPFFTGMPKNPEPIRKISQARCLVSLGDSTTTDHISPAGNIKEGSPAGLFLTEQGVAPSDFNSYGARRGNDRVMTRGTFANIRLKNLLAPGTEGSVTIHHPSGEQTSIFDASRLYAEAETPLVVLAGSEYGTGSSRDWAAKGTFLLGIRAVFATSFERIHRSNLVGMGVLPLQFLDGESRESLGLDGTETFNIQTNDSLKPKEQVTVTAIKADGTAVNFCVTCRIDTPVEVDYYRHGGILQYVLRQLLKS